MANILLVYPKPGKIRERRFGFSLTLLYLSSILKAAGHHIVRYLDYSLEPFDAAKFRENVQKADVVILEFDSFPLKRAVNIRHGEELVSNIKDNYQKLVILVGDDITLFPSERRSADFVIPRDPEKNISIVIDALLNRREVPPLQSLENLDRLPFPDRSSLPPEAECGGSIDSPPHLEKSTLLQTSRGCANNCVFCQRKAWNKQFQAHSIPYVLKEFSGLQTHRYRNIWLTDDNFTHDLNRAKTLLRELADKNLTSGMKIALSSWTHIDEEFLELARKANVSIISFGVESANPEILKFYKKKIHLQAFRELIRFADVIGLYTVGNFIVGAPMETETTISKTFDYAMGSLFDQVNIKILDYMAGSDLYETLPPGLKTRERHVFGCRENGLNNFPLKTLKDRTHRFREEFRQSRKEHLKNKINRNGAPYYLL